MTSLYEGNRCSLIVAGGRQEGFEMHSGIREGCPLSPQIFAVAMDILLRRAKRLVKDTTSRAFPDDIAMVATRGFDQIPAIHQLLTDFAPWSGLELNLQKTIITPLSETDPEAHRQRLLAVGPG